MTSLDVQGMAGRSLGLASATGPLQRKRMSSFSLQAASTLLLLAIQVIHVTSANQTTGNDTAYVSSQGGSSTLLSALLDNSIQHIFVQQPEYNVRQEFEPYQGKPIELNRNVTISGAEGLNSILDLDFVASAVQLCPTCRLTFTNITVANERHGTGEAIDFVVGGANSSAAVLFLNSNKLRLVCSAGADAAAVTQQSPRSKLAGKQLVDLQDVSYKGAQFPASLHLIDVALAVPHETVEGWKGGSGGYILLANNVTRLCYNTVDQACLRKGTPEACVTAQMDEVRAAAGRDKSSSTVGKTVGIAIGAAAAGLALLTGVACFVYWLKRRRRSGSAHQISKASRSSFDSATGPGQLSKVHSSGFVGPGYEHDLAEAGEVNVDQLRVFDSFIEGCNFVRAPLGVRKGWEVSRVLTSPSAESSPGSDRKDIQLGQFLGAGSFGRVYRAKWGGRDVAVKVIEHNSDASDAVESEVQLMFKFSNHPNIVRAFYAITYTQNSNPTLPNGTSSSNSINLARDFGGVPLNSSAGSSSNNRIGVVSSGSGQRAALARLRSLPLQEIATENAAGISSAAAAAAAAAGSDDASSFAAAVAAAGSETLDRREFAAGRARLPPLQRIDSDDQPQHQQQLLQQFGVAAAAAGSAAAAGEHDQGSPSDLASAKVYDNIPSGFAGSSVAVRGSSLGSTDCVSRVYSWMGSSGLGPVMGGQCSGGKRNSESSEGLKQGRAETWLVQEFCDLGTLGGIVAEWNPAEENDERMLQRLLLLQGAAAGLKVLHSMNTVHGDLTARNVLVASSKEAQFGMVAKLADLGLSRVIKLHRTHRTTNTVGTLSHMPPELLRYGHCSTAVDIYAFGVMMWELFTNKAAFNKLQYGQFYETVVLRNLRPLVPRGMPADYSLLMQHCWASDAMQRPNVDRVLHCLGLMIAERQCRLSDLGDTAAARVQSAPLPDVQRPQRVSRNMPPNTAVGFSAKRRMSAEAPDGMFVHRSCPGPDEMVRPLRGPTAAAMTAAMLTAQQQQQPQHDEIEEAEVGIWKGPPSRFSWGDRSGVECNTPSAPLRPPLPLLQRYVSDDFGMDLGRQEENWFV